MSGIRWTTADYAAYLAREAARKNRAAVSAADVEPDPKPEPSQTDVRQNVHPRVRIHVHSKRRRLADPDGIQAKSAIDGLVRGGLLKDDSAKHVEAISFSQERSKVEETIIEVWEVT